MVRFLFVETAGRSEISLLTSTPTMERVPIFRCHLHRARQSQAEAASGVIQGLLQREWDPSSEHVPLKQEQLHDFGVLQNLAMMFVPLVPAHSLARLCKER